MYIVRGLGANVAYKLGAQRHLVQTTRAAANMALNRIEAQVHPDNAITTRGPHHDEPVKPSGHGIAPHPGAYGGCAGQRAGRCRIQRRRSGLIAWRGALAPYYAEFGIDPNSIATATPRLPFSAAVADVLAEFAPPVVSFHFGLPAAGLLARVKAWGAKVLSSATTVDEALWLQAHGVDAVIAAGGIADAKGVAAALALGAKAQELGSGDFSPLWAGQNVAGCREVPAGALTRELAGLVDRVSAVG